MDSYFIKDGYTANLDSNNQVVEQYTAIPNNKTYQIACYKMAAELIKSRGLKTCIELGSGSGYKLNKYIAPLVDKAVGIDMQHSVDHCRKFYPGVEWVCDDFDNPANTITDKFDMAFSFDVIEHLVYPEKLLQKLKSYVKPGGVVLISTPERDRLWGKAHFGPSTNRKHVREWNQEEFANLLTHFGLIVDQHVVLPDQTFSLRDRIWAVRNKERAVARNTCQLAICRIKQA
jgi:2-polyprenyl-3-methyl-5-hydroxy-6-metoxy-1,4-benzoquinol methylase